MKENPVYRIAMLIAVATVAILFVVFDTKDLAYLPFDARLKYRFSYFIYIAMGTSIFLKLLGLI